MYTSFHAPTQEQEQSKNRARIEQEQNTHTQIEGQISHKLSNTIVVFPKKYPDSTYTIHMKMDKLAWMDIGKYVLVDQLYLR